MSTCVTRPTELRQDRRHVRQSVHCERPVLAQQHEGDDVQWLGFE